MSESQLPQSLLRVLASLTEWFKDQHVPYAIIGGAAIGFLAQPRATQDIDAVTWLDLAETAGFVKSGSRFGFFREFLIQSNSPSSHGFSFFNTIKQRSMLTFRDRGGRWFESSRPDHCFKHLRRSVTIAVLLLWQDCGRTDCERLSPLQPQLA